MNFLSHSVEETFSIANLLAKHIGKNSIVCFFGELGTGKTTFIKGLTFAVSGYSPEDVSSPTFTFLNIYRGEQTVYHFDLYRLKDEEEFLSMGFDEYFYADGICCIEWSERISALLPRECINVILTHAGKDARHISIIGIEKK